jgi:hypothetical protein
VRSDAGFDLGCPGLRCAGHAVTCRDEAVGIFYLGSWETEPSKNPARLAAWPQVHAHYQGGKTVRPTLRETGLG